MISGCAATNAGPEAGAAGDGTIVCEVFYRSTASGSMDAAPAIIFAGGSQQQGHQFDDMAFEARFQDDPFEGRALAIAVIDLDSGKEISRQLYQLDPQNPLENQFIGGHGFSGLNYVFHPDSAAEMQYFCSLQ